MLRFHLLSRAERPIKNHQPAPPAHRPMPPSLPGRHPTHAKTPSMARQPLAGETACHRAPLRPSPAVDEAAPHDAPSAHRGAQREQRRHEVEGSCKQTAADRAGCVSSATTTAAAVPLPQRQPMLDDVAQRTDTPERPCFVNTM